MKYALKLLLCCVKEIKLNKTVSFPTTMHILFNVDCGYVMLLVTCPMLKN